MGSSPDEEDVERVDRDYVDPNSTTRDQIKRDLEDEGIDGESNRAFRERILSETEVVNEVREDLSQRQNSQVVTREEVGDTVSRLDVPRNPDRDDALTDAAAREVGAPSESELTRARRSIAQRVDEDGVVRTDPSLDPFGGSEGREIGEVSELTRRTGGRGGGFTEGVDRTGSDSGTFYLESPDGERFPVAEVDL